MPVLNDALATQLNQLLTNISHPIELIASLDDSTKGREMRELLEQITAMSDLVSLREESNERTPSFAVSRIDSPISVRFAGSPLGHEFTSLVLALLHVGGHPMKLSDEQIAAVRGINADRHFITYMSLTCTNCPDVVQALNMISILNPRIQHTVVEGGTFSEEVTSLGVMSVPAVYENGELFHSGRSSIDDFISLLDSAADERAAEAISSEAPFDVLVIGGGPAASAAAIYAARKGIRVGMVAQRMGGQVLDTISIENLISVPHTEGPTLAAKLREHIDNYPISVFAPQVVSSLKPASEGGLHEVVTDTGARLQSKAIVLATGASWRLMGVPGEDAYRNKGVSFCPHCDGPLFAGKRVVVVGGGNSGVEAAIDLAGVAEHVTIVEFMDELKADAILVDKCHSLPNIDVVTSARTTEVHGDGTAVTHLSYEDRPSGELRQIDCQGVFVQIGLMPATSWLGDTVELSDRGEIVIDVHGRTNIPGVFAAGDCTTVPYKQIVIAHGAGATAALSAFDYLIRQ